METKRRVKEVVSDSPDASNYEVETVEQIGIHLILKVRYPNCQKCSFEGQKVMVFLNVKAIDAVKWKRIDPHFRSPPFNALEAPSPDARFPPTKSGWCDAVGYARGRDFSKG